jgi:hypothetical protein
MDEQRECFPEGRLPSAPKIGLPSILFPCLNESEHGTRSAITPAKSGANSDTQRVSANDAALPLIGIAYGISDKETSIEAKQKESIPA